MFPYFSIKTLCYGYSSELSCQSPWQGDSNEYPQHMFLWRIEENYSVIRCMVHVPVFVGEPEFVPYFNDILHFTCLRICDKCLYSDVQLI